MIISSVYFHNQGKMMISYIHHRPTHFLLLLSLLPFCFTPMTFASPYSFNTDTLTHQQRVRTFHLYKPHQQQTSKTPIPTIIALHGGGKRGGKAMAKYIGFNQLAKQQHFMMVYPEGIRSQWNDGRKASYRGKKFIEHIDDVGFLTKLTHLLITRYGADANRLYLVGVSNGGMMSQRMACEAGEPFAAIASVIASMPQAIYAHCQPKKARPMLLMNGTADPFIPYQGGEVVIFGKHAGNVLSTAQTLTFWRQQNKINSLPSIYHLPNNNTKDHSTVIKKVWFDSQQKERVVLYRIQNGGHQWPSSSHRFQLKKWLGFKNKDIKGANVLWDFFKQHTHETTP